VNILGVKQTGRLQSIIVTVVVAVLFLFVADGITYVDSTHYHPFFPEGGGGLLAATGFVFVSYAGVTKIASVAEEVENPGRNIPLAMLVSILLMMLVYALVMFVVVGVTQSDQLAGTLTPMAAGAEHLFDSTGVVLVAGVAVVALISMANAGVLSASRFPFAMSRDGLAPPAIERVSDRFQTPVVALLLTGAVLLVLIGFVPVIELAKLASAFKILVFALVNVALIAFRESDLGSYDPEFVAPGYPWVQLFGLGASLVLLTQMGLVPFLGAVGIIVSGAAWYRFYGRDKTEREGAALDAIRQSLGSLTINQVERMTASDPSGNVLVAISPDTSPERERTLLTLAGHVARQRGGTVHAVLFEEVPEQVSLSSAAETETEIDRAFEDRTGELSITLPTPVEIDEIVSHDTRRAVLNYADRINANFLFGDTSTGRFHDELLGYDIDWFMRHALCDVVFVRNRGLDQVNEVAVLAQRGPHGPLKVALASAVAQSAGGVVRFVTVVREDAPREQVRSVEEFHTELEALCDVETSSDIVTSDDLVAALVDATTGADVAVVGHDPHTLFHDVVLGDLSSEIADELRCSVLLVHSRIPGSVLRRLLRRVAG
jgi:nucleotide-binding universal stress UspA family protein